MEEPLLKQLDHLVSRRHMSRSKLLSDLVRAELLRRSKLTLEGQGILTVTLIYDHRIRDLSEKLTAMQHDLGRSVRSTLHVHLPGQWCMEVLAVEGPASFLRTVAERLSSVRGVRHAATELVAGFNDGPIARPSILAGDGCQQHLPPVAGEDGL